MSRISRGKMLAAEIAAFTISQFQEFNRTLYEVQNDQLCYDPPVMITRIGKHATGILKSVRKSRIGDISYHACMAFSWAMALANRLHLNMDVEIWKRFPGVCPYCKWSTCKCKTKRAKNRKRVVVDLRLRPSSCYGYQQMFKVMYPQSLAEAASHLAEETNEVDRALQKFIGSGRTRKNFDKVVLELVDLISTIYAVANTAGFDLATEMGRWFRKGCPGCSETPCDCQYSARHQDD